jgi:trimeric autotransporter adhesin
VIFSAGDETRRALKAAFGAAALVVLLGCEAPGPLGSPYLVKEFGQGGPRRLVDVEGTLFFIAADEVHGSELWRSDGRPEGTRLVRDVRPGPDPPGCFRCDIGPFALSRVGARLFFNADDGLHGYEPWVSDGTEAGTHMVEDINPGHDASLGMVSFVDRQGTAFFVAADPVFGRELWRSDGTPQGTHVVRDIGPGADAVPALGLRSMGDRIYFPADDGLHGEALWRTDGTERGTFLLADLLPGSSFSNVSGFVRLQRSRLDYFTALDDTGWGLWRTDGTPGGTARVTPLREGAGVAAEVRERLVLTARDAVAGLEIWRSDGTAAGTGLLKDINPGPADSFPGGFTVLHDVVLFGADDGAHGWELWRSDGTAAGTFLLRDIAPGGPSGSPRALVRAGRLVYFTAKESAGDPCSLWMTDGTPEGTRRVPMMEPICPGELVPSGHRLFFTAFGLWAIDVN